MNFPWSRDKVKRLISLVEGLPTLWDLSSNDYKNKEKKQEALQILAEAFGTTAIEINRKIHNLRTQLNNEVRKKRRKIGHGTDEFYNSTWDHFEALQYMLQSSTTNNPKRDVEHPTTSTADSNSLSSVALQTLKTSNNPEKLKKSKTKKSEMLEKALKMMIEPDDDIAIYGAFVASALRNLRSDKYRRKLKRHIQRVILEIEEQEEQELMFLT